MVFVESFGEREGGLPWCFDFNAWFDIFEALHVLLVGQDLSQKLSTFIFCDTTLFGSASCHIPKRKFQNYYYNPTPEQILKEYCQLVYDQQQSLRLASCNKCQLQIYIELMNLISNLQKQYEQLWKYIVRPPRLPYSEKRLGPVIYRYQGVEAQRKDFRLKNSRGLEFACSLWLPTKSEKANVVVYMHGNSSNRLQGVQYLGRLIAAGIGLCTFDFSGCGNAEGEYISLGYFQQQDLELVLKELKVYPRIDKVAIWGRSMGAVTALLYLPKDNRISAVILDSPFKSLKCLIEDMAQKTTKIPGFVLSAAFKIVQRTIRQKAGFSLYKLDPFKLSVPKLYVPAFFIVGIEDDVIPIQHTGQLFEMYATDDKVIKMVNGGHNDKRPELIIESALQFLKQKFEEEEKYEKDNSETAASKSEEKDERDYENSEMKTQQIIEVQQALKAGKFTWSSLFSAFSNNGQKKQTAKEQQLGVKQQNQSTAQLLKQEKMERRQKEKKKEKKQKQQSKQYEVPFQEKLREYSYCYL